MQTALQLNTSTSCDSSSSRLSNHILLSVWSAIRTLKKWVTHSSWLCFVRLLISIDTTYYAIWIFLIIKTSCIADCKCLIRTESLQTLFWFLIFESHEEVFFWLFFIAFSLWLFAWQINEIWSIRLIKSFNHIVEILLLISVTVSDQWDLINWLIKFINQLLFILLIPALSAFCFSNSWINTENAHINLFDHRLWTVKQPDCWLLTCLIRLKKTFPDQLIFSFD